MRRKGAALSLLSAVLLCTSCSVGDLSNVGKVFKVAKTAKDGFAAGMKFDYDEELEIGGTVAAYLIATHGVVADTRATDYVNLVAASVSAESERGGVLAKVRILDTDTPNAFCCPGAYIFVTKGLLKLCKDESELAGVLGHEFTHFAKRHTLRKLEKTKRGKFVGKTVSEMANLKNSALFKIFEGVVAKAVGDIANNKHGRKAETECDLIGCQLAAMAGYDGEGLARLVERMPDTGAWKEQFSKYDSGESRGDMIRKTIRKEGLGGGVKNAGRYKKALAGILGS
jgi:predicted Zn-dependent protease